MSVLNLQKPAGDELTDLVQRLDPRRADAPRDERVKVLMAIHGADSGPHGAALAEQFSRQSPKYDERDFAATWKILKPGPVRAIAAIPHKRAASGFAASQCGCLTSLAKV